MFSSKEELEITVDCLIKKIWGLETRLTLAESYKQSYKELEVKYNDLLKEQEKIKAFSELDVSNNKLIKENNKLTKDIEKLTKENERLKNENKDLSKKYSISITENNNLIKIRNTKIDKLEKENQELKQRLETKKEVKDLIKNLKEETSCI